ncbi:MULTISPECIES: hypothetical protein [Galbibacter]|uniref:Dihydrolipoamide dehydrogenase n=1 Tax=Galbibacter orientalis DSM 19592 TaxID=926559 RepID=I3C999_9FLAO|nr:hypothetical protein [Galbibacter orientalis]EIJ40192.1 hypothetical protein JoomaDRAFT_3246 [Galbibacter orientalis DSM 19592]
MKKIITLLFVATLVFTSCEGPEGPPGPPGYDGAVAEFFETTVNFNSANEFSQLIPIPDNIEISDFDVLQVYLLWGQDNNGNDIWRALPQTRQLDQGDLIYNFDYTIADVNLFLEAADFDLNTLLPGDTQNQVFRIAIIPSYQAKNMDLSNMDQVMKAANIKSIQKLN